MGRTITISDETFEKLKVQLLEDEVFEINSFDELIGKKFLFRTVTFFLLGEVTKQFGKFVQLKNASWIADTGRFMNCIKEGKLDEVEPVGDVFVNMDTVVDFFLWKHKLPTDQK